MLKLIERKEKFAQVCGRGVTKEYQFLLTEGIPSSNPKVPLLASEVPHVAALTWEEAESIVSRVAAKGEKEVAVPPHRYEFPELIDAAADIHCAAADRGASDA